MPDRIWWTYPSCDRKRITESLRLLEGPGMMLQVKAFDKVARAVGLGYPGGPKVDKAAKGGKFHMLWNFRGQK